MMGPKNLNSSKTDDSDDPPQPPKELAKRAVGRWQAKIREAARQELSGHDMETLIDEVAWLLEAGVNGDVNVDLGPESRW